MFTETQLFFINFVSKIDVNTLHHISLINFYCIKLGTKHIWTVAPLLCECIDLFVQIICKELLVRSTFLVRCKRSVHHYIRKDINLKSFGALIFSICFRTQHKMKTEKTSLLDFLEKIISHKQKKVILCRTLYLSIPEGSKCREMAGLLSLN